LRVEGQHFQHLLWSVNKGKNFPSFLMLAACWVISSIRMRSTTRSALVPMKRSAVNASRWLKTTLYKAYTDDTCTSLCNNILNIVFKHPVSLIYEYHFTHFSIYLSVWISTCIIIICIPHAAHLTYKELVWVTSEINTEHGGKSHRLPVRFHVLTAVTIKGAAISPMTYSLTLNMKSAHSFKVYFLFFFVS
jgi:hypothetical protein